MARYARKESRAVKTASEEKEASTEKPEFSLWRLYERYGLRFTGVKMKKVLPHKDVYCRVGRSKVHGVGVIAIIDIPKGFNPFKHSLDKVKKFKKKDILKGLKPGHKKLYTDFCAEEGEYLWTPVHFNRMDISWFLNHSKTPNVRAADKTGSYFHTLRKIKAGEELFSDYNTYCESKNICK